MRSWAATDAACGALKSLKNIRLQQRSFSHLRCGGNLLPRKREPSAVGGVMLEQFSHSLVEKLITSLIVIPVLCYLAWVVLRYLGHLALQAWRFIRSRRRALQAVAREVAENGAFEGKGVWLTTPIERPHDYWRGVTSS